MTQWPRASRSQVTAWRKLRTKKGRKESGQILLEGVRLVADVIQAKVPVVAVIIPGDERGRTAWQNLLSRTGANRFPVIAASPREFDQLTDTVNAAGIACVANWSTDRFDPSEMHFEVHRMLICDGIADPGNLGTLIRTAAGLGLDAVFLSAGTAELSNPKTVRAAAGALFRIPIYEQVDLKTLATWCRKRSVQILAADAHGDNPFVELGDLGKWALVVGGEAHGLSPFWDSVTVIRIGLALARNVESLNAAVAGAILMDRLCRKSEGNPAERLT